MSINTKTVIYDQYLHQLGVLWKSKRFCSYVIKLESHNLYFRCHPKDWGEDSDEDRNRFIILGKL